MTAQIIPVDTFDLVVFGGAGDLARRKLPHLSSLPCSPASRSPRQSCTWHFRTSSLPAAREWRRAMRSQPAPQDDHRPGESRRASGEMKRPGSGRSS
jgi:hypothetical protein